MAARKKRGNTRSRRNARIRRIEITTAATAQTASGTMNGPPRSKNPAKPSQKALATSGGKEVDKDDMAQRSDN